MVLLKFVGVDVAGVQLAPPLVDTTQVDGAFQFPKALLLNSSLAENADPEINNDIRKMKTNCNLNFCILILLSKNIFMLILVKQLKFVQKNDFTTTFSS